MKQEQRWRNPERVIALATGLVGLWVPMAAAQLVPDGSLGREASVVVPGQYLGEAIDHIQGGAARGGGLFHSFLEFNVGEGQRVYFDNPAAITTIFSRVTGDRVSTILGRLGVLGDAHLYLINPNGIIFGPNSELDLRGAFWASTAPEIRFGNGLSFSAVDPQPLLTVTGQLGLASWLPPTRGAITVAGQLATPGDLTVMAQDVTLTGGARAGGTLDLRAVGNLVVQDRAAEAVVATAGGDLTLQGGSLIIEALGHPDSGIYAGGDLVLRSPQPVVGDAHYWAGGNFRLEQLDGTLGVLTSPQDPIIRASGDVSFDSYRGASLHILAGGQVTIPGTIEITGPDLGGNAISPTTTPSLATVSLSNGQTLTIDGVTQPTLDIRAGTTAFGPAGVSGDLGGVVGDPTRGGSAGTSGAITVGTILNPGGLVFLTNRYQPNAQPGRDIAVDTISTADFAGGGNVVIDSAESITFRNIDVSGGDIATFDIGGHSGGVRLLATGPITMPLPSFIEAYGLNTSPIILNSDEAIIQEGAPLGTDPFDLSFIDMVNLGSGPGGGVHLKAPAIVLGGNVITTTLGTGSGGPITIQADDTLDTFQSSIITFTFGDGPSGPIRVRANHINLDYSALLTTSDSPSGGGAGNVDIRTSSLTATTGAQMGSFAFARGDAGNVVVQADQIALSGFQPGDLSGGIFSASSIFSSVQAGAVGNSGTLTVTTGTLRLTEAGSIGTTSFGQGNAGDIVVTAQESVVIEGAVYVDFIDASQPSGITSELFAGATGNGGSITVNTPRLQLLNGGTITALSNGDGGAGTVTINATESVTLDGVVSFAEVGAQDRISRMVVAVRDEATGNGGTLTINSPRLILRNGAQLSASTEGAGNAGNIVLNLTEDLQLSGDGTGILANTTAGSTGDGGSILIDPARIVIVDGARISVASEGSGAAGDIVLEGGNLILDRGLVTAETLSSRGGNITLRLDDIILLVNNSRISTTAGTALAGGDGGNLTLTTTYLLATPNGNNDITANAFSGAGGNVLITAAGIFGLTPRSRADLEALLGTSDPALLDPARLPSSDITAISRGNPDLQGQVIIQSPDVDPSQGVVPLADNILDASRLIAQGCASGGTVAQEIGSLVVTGRGGLPPSPTDRLGTHQVLVDWATGDGVVAGSGTEALPPTAPPTPALAEAQSMVRDAEGRVALVALSAPPTLSTLTCAGVPLGETP